MERIIQYENKLRYLVSSPYDHLHCLLTLINYRILIDGVPLVGNYMKQDSIPKTDKGNKVDEEHIHHDVQKNQAEAKLGMTFFPKFLYQTERFEYLSSKSYVIHILLHFSIDEVLIS
jgi:hypothetical protein